MQVGAGNQEQVNVFSLDKTEIELSRDNKTLFVNGKGYELETLSNGGFKGFPTKRVYVSLMVGGVTGAGSFNIVQLNNQSIKQIVNDVISPEFYTEQLEGGLFSRGETYVLKPAYSADVLDMGIITGLTVRLPNRQYVVATDGTVLNNAPYDREYTIKLESYGIYSISYNASASMYAGKRGLTYTVSVLDEVAPTITLSTDKSGQSAGLNKTVKIPQVTVSDNLTETENLKINKFVISPDDIITEIMADTILNDNCLGGNIKSETEIKLTMKGVYRILYRVEDEAGNVATTEYRITVK
jgi:hypothetical protein